MNRTLTASGYFTAMIEEYDSLIRRAVPRYDAMIERLVAYLPDSPGRALELGCGTGNLTLALADARPEWELMTLDASPDMVRLTRRRLGLRARRGHGVTCLAARFEFLPFEAERFDVVVSAISLHHVEDKASLFGAIRRVLRPGGALRFSDQLAASASAVDELNWAEWLEFCRQPGNCSEAEIESLVAHADEHDHYVSLGEHFRLLDEAGFRNVDCAWKDGMWGVITAEV